MYLKFHRHQKLCPFSKKFAMRAIYEMDYPYLVGRLRYPKKEEAERTIVVEQWLGHGAPPGLFDGVISNKCALREQQVRQLLLFASWVPPVLRCRCYQHGSNNRVRSFHWPSCVEESGLLILINVEY